MLKIIRKPKKININKVEEMNCGDMFELEKSCEEVFILLNNDGSDYIDCYNINTNIVQKIHKLGKCYKIFNQKLEYEVETL